MARLNVPLVLDQGRLIEWLKEDLSRQVERSVQVGHTFGTVVDTSERIRHGLGAVPKGWYVVEKDRACDVYRSATDKASDDRYIWLKSGTASAAVTLLVF
jgi:hypothetical protein